MEARGHNKGPSKRNQLITICVLQKIDVGKKKKRKKNQQRIIIATLFSSLCSSFTEVMKRTVMLLLPKMTMIMKHRVDPERIEVTPSRSH